MRIDYTPEDRYTWYDLPIKDCCNHSHVSAYVILDGNVHLLALQVMRDKGLQARTHRQLARLRREYQRMPASIDNFQRDVGDYAAWQQLQRMKDQRRSILRDAEDVYNAMFLTPAWQAWKAQQTNK